jgi:hypothetical protein
VFGLPALDVAIGLIFVYFIFSLICSKINEWVATKLRQWRAEGLENGIRNLIGDGNESLNVEAIWNHPLVRGMLPPAEKVRKRQRKPSYLPSGTFALAVVDLLAPPQPLADITDAVADLPDEDARMRLNDLVMAAEVSPDKASFDAIEAEARSLLAGISESQFIEVINRARTRTGQDPLNRIKVAIGKLPEQHPAKEALIRFIRVWGAKNSITLLTLRAHTRV